MKQPLFIIISALFMMNLSSVWAVNCPTGTTLNTDCWDCGKTTGKITCSFSQGVFTISGEGEMKDWGIFTSHLPWYKYNEDITSVVFAKGSNIKSLPQYAFYGAKNLTTIDLPDTIEAMGWSAFCGSGITSIKIPEGVTRLEATLFSDAQKLESITLPSTLTYISDSAFQNTYKLKEISIPDTLTAENINKLNYFPVYKSFNCVKADGSNGGDDMKCIAALSKFIRDDDGNCNVQYPGCISTSKIGNTCIGQYFGSTANDGTCVTKSSCTSNKNYVVNLDTRQCMKKTDCSDGYIVDEQNKRCVQLPGCGTFENGRCTTCTDGYLTNSSGSCTLVADCKDGLHADDGACVANPEGCNTFADNKCSECNSGLIKQEGTCVSSCGPSFHLNEGECDRILYTPAEAAAVLTNDNNNSVTITFKK